MLVEQVKAFPMSSMLSLEREVEAVVEVVKDQT